MPEVIATATPPAKIGVTKKSSLVKTINKLAARLNEQAPLLKKAGELPDYGGRFTALTHEIKRVPSGAPNYTRQLGERPYSLLKVAQLARGMIGPDQACEEVQISQKLSKAFNQVQFSGAHAAGQSWLIPMHTDYLPQDTPENISLVAEVKQKCAATPADWDAIRHLQRKGWGVDLGEIQMIHKNLGTVADTAGGTFVQPPQIIELLEMQYKMEAWSRAGATQIPMMPNGRAYISKINQGATAFYADEGINFSSQASQQVTGQLLLLAKKIAVLVSLNNELLRFGMPATETMVRYDMARQAALFADAEMFTGTGGTHINGILSPAYPSQTPPWTQGTDAWLNYSATPVVAATPIGPTGIGTNGNVFNPDDTDKMVNQLPDEITPDEVTFLMTRSLYAGISSRRAAAISAGDNAGVFVGQRLVGLTKRINEDVEGYRTVWSSNVPTNRVKGTSSNLTTCIVGRFSDAVIARLGVGEIVANSFNDGSWFTDSTSLRLIQQIDFGLRYVASFGIYDSLYNG